MPEEEAGLGVGWRGSCGWGEGTKLVEPRDYAVAMVAGCHIVAVVREDRDLDRHINAGEDVGLGDKKQKSDAHVKTKRK